MSITTIGRGNVIFGTGALCLAWACVPAPSPPLHAPPDDALRAGDVVFQESPSAQSAAIRAATGSPWTHCGVLFLHEGSWWVWEGVQPVGAVPWEQWRAAGTGGRFAVKRYQGPRKDSLPIEAMQLVARGFEGKDYDGLFGWSDERIYCSELVWKVFARGADIELCAPRPLGDNALGDPEVVRVMAERYGSSPPLDMPTVSPADLFNCPLLHTVVEGP